MDSTTRKLEETKTSDTLLIEELINEILGVWRGEGYGKEVPNITSNISLRSLCERYDTHSVLGFIPGLMLTTEFLDTDATIETLVDKLREDNVVEKIISVQDNNMRRHLADFFVAVGVHYGVETISKIADVIDIDNLRVSENVYANTRIPVSLDYFDQSLFQLKVIEVLESSTTSVPYYKNLQAFSATDPASRSFLTAKVDGTRVDGKRHETSMFRRIHQFKTFQRLITDEYAKDHKIRILSLGCSNGKEAYSIAAVLLGNGYTDFEVVGVDKSAECLAIAQRGKYLNNPAEVCSINGALFHSDVKAAGINFPTTHYNLMGNVVVSDDIFRRVRFQQGDVTNLILDDRYDFVFINNVLGYLSTDERRRTLQGIANLNPKYVFTDGNEGGKDTSTLGSDLFSVYLPETTLRPKTINYDHAVLVQAGTY